MEVMVEHVPGLVIRKHEFIVPLDYQEPESEQIKVFARELRSIDNADKELPVMVYLQGGPGFESPRPLRASGWIKEALKSHRVLLLDQRGTGLSTPVNNRTLATRGSAEEQLRYLSCFRADSIVQDAERIRTEWLGADQLWTIVGQSFGGFCAVHYLSAAPEGLEAALITGGLPPLGGHPDEVYYATYKRVLKRNQTYWSRYPEDQHIVQEILSYIHNHKVVLPNGTRLTMRVFQQLGMRFGMSTGFEALHYLLEDAFVEGPDGLELSYRFLKQVNDRLPFDGNPIYALLHEAIYCQGEASLWSAHRIRKQFPQFDSDDPFLFVGEMVYPWMFEDYQYLKDIAPVAELLAAKVDWPDLYDLDVLAENTVPCAAVIYDDDMYVERQFSVQTAEQIQGMKTWVTNEFDHDGIGVEGARILNYLQDLRKGKR